MRESNSDEVSELRKENEQFNQLVEVQSLIDLTGNTLGGCFAALVHCYSALQGEDVDAQGMLLLKWLIFVNRKLANASDEIRYLSQKVR